MSPEDKYFPRLGGSDFVIGEPVARDEVPKSLLERIEELQKEGHIVHVCKDRKYYSIFIYDPQTDRAMQEDILI